MPVNEFRIVPGGLHPCSLGMSLQQIERAMGAEPTKHGSGLPDEEVYRYQDFGVRIAMRDERAVEISLTPPARVLLEGKSLFADGAVWQELVAMDGDAREALGFIVLPRLRFALTGFHDRNSGQLAISAFEAGRWNLLENKMKPLVL